MKYLQAWGYSIRVSPEFTWIVQDNPEINEEELEGGAETGLATDNEVRG